MSYNPRSGNPFTLCDPNKEWTSNNLILQDPKLRVRAGVAVLDNDVSEMFPCKDLQAGGATVGAPLHIKYFGSKHAVPYETSVSAAQIGGGFPYHYFTNNGKW